MKITLLGAAGGEVTGSSYLVQTNDAAVLVDCGLFQGAQKLENSNRLPTTSALQRLDAVVLTHAHLDHTGRLPLLTRFGYKKPIYATAATIALAELILKDSAYLQSEDAKRQNRRRSEAGKPPVEPLYTQKEVDRLHSLYRRMRYQHATDVAPGISVRAVEAGHILGSASLEMTVRENGRTKVVVFSGDIGPRGAPLHRDPVPFKHADLVFMESTYGDKEHPSLAETAAAARAAVKETVDRGGRVLVPVFAIGRSQLLLYMLAGAFKRGTLTPFPIFLDSPMAIRATGIYRSYPELFDEEAIAMRASGELSANLRTVKACQKAKDSMALTRKPGPWMVLAGAGMCTGGRILNHLQNHLPDPTTLLLMVGYQSRGSVGRALADGAKEVRIAGQRVAVRAKTHLFGGLSGHAGQSDLLNWLGSLAQSCPRVLLTHGEDGPRQAMRARIHERLGLTAEMPRYRQVIEC
ncbi:MAG TPA: MBL fold metallo-hydrolase [Vicinamibacterales bacterium]|jgi:metallo-beta-lactamase family protein